MWKALFGSLLCCLLSTRLSLACQCLPKNLTFQEVNEDIISVSPEDEIFQSEYVGRLIKVNSVVFTLATPNK